MSFGDMLYVVRGAPGRRSVWMESQPPGARTGHACTSQLGPPM